MLPQESFLHREMQKHRRRLEALEALEYIAEAGNADTVDDLHAAAAGANAHVLATGESGQARLDGLLQLRGGLRLWPGGTNGVQGVYLPRKQLVAGVPTALFSITTTNEGGDNDAGVYSVWLLAQAGHATGSAASVNTASMMAQYMFTRAQKNTGAGVTGFEAEIYQTASAATDPAARDISGIALTTAEVSEYVLNVLFNVGLTGTAKTVPYVDALVLLMWQAYTTPPEITAL